MSVFTEAELGMSTGIANPMDILDEATYLSDDESRYDVKMVPVRENSRIGAAVVQFDDLASFAESNGVDYLTAMEAIAEANAEVLGEVPLAVAVNEEDVIVDPEIVNELANVVIKPVSEDSIGYMYTMACLEAWMDAPEGEEADQALYNSLVEDTDLEAFLEAENVEAQKKRVQWAKEKLANIKSALDGARASNKDQSVVDGLIGRWKAAQQDVTKKENALQALMKSASTAASNAFGAHQKNQDADNAKRNSILGSVGGGHSAANYSDSDLDSYTGHKASFMDKAKGFISGNKGKIAGAGLGLAAAIAAGNKLLNRSDAPKSLIGQKIAALRNVYHSWLARAQKESDQGKASIIKKAAAKLMSIIDALAKKLQGMAG